MKLGDACRSFLEFRFRVPPIPIARDSPIVFWAEFGAEPLSLPFLNVHPDSNSDRHHESHDKDHDGRTERGLIHFCISPNLPETWKPEGFDSISQQV
jgi:hypothetical protein